MEETRSQKLMNQSTPWKGDANWLVIGVEAVALLGIGIFMLVDKSTASEMILQLIGLVLLMMSLSLGWASLRGTGRLGVIDAFRAGIGVAIGAIATSGWWSDTLSNDAIRLILGWGLVAYGALHLAGLLINRENFRMVGLVIAALTVVLGILLLTTDGNYESRITFLAWTAIAFGVLLGAATYLLYSREKKAAGTGTGTTTGTGT